MEIMMEIEFMVGLHDYLCQSDEDYWKTHLHDAIERCLKEAGATYDDDKGEWMKDGKPII